jgi:hypothetical protein
VALRRALLGTVPMIMEHGLLTGYASPEVTDYGSLVEITASVHLLMGAADMSDLSFSAAHTPGGGGQGIDIVNSGGDKSPVGAGEVVPGGGPSASAGNLSATGSGPAGGGGEVAVPGGGSAGGSGSGGGGGGQLPFTGFAAGAAAAVGSALAASGAALRRASRTRRRS